MRREGVPKAVTASEVARLAGVSTAVVSYVVNNGPRPVAPVTAERVQRAIDILGYVPNLAARSLKVSGSEMVGLVLPDTTNPFFVELAHAVQREADRRQQVVVVTSHRDDAERQRGAVSDLTRRGITQVLIASPVGDADRLPESVRVVLLDRSDPVPGMSTMGPNAEHGAFSAVQHLTRDHHHDQVALIVGETGENGPESRERGWLRACRAAGRAPGSLIRVPFTREGGHAAGRRLLERDRPRAVFVSSDLQAFGVLNAAWQLGLRVPEDLAIVTFDGTAGSAYTCPSLTAVQQPTGAIAEAALRELNLETGPRSVHQRFDMQLVKRRSCGCPDEE